MELVVAAIILAGAFGGTLNTLGVDNTFGKLKLGPGGWILALITNWIFGAAAAFLSWTAYGPISSYPVFGPLASGAPPPISQLTYAQLATATFLGIGGSRWISNEVDKRLLTAAASTAARKVPNDNTAADMLTARPAGVKSLADAMVPPQSTENR
jgi:hypothetical protein